MAGSSPGESACPQRPRGSGGRQVRVLFRPPHPIFERAARVTGHVSSRLTTSSRGTPATENPHPARSGAYRRRRGSTWRHGERHDVPGFGGRRGGRMDGRRPNTRRSRTHAHDAGGGRMDGRGDGGLGSACTARADGRRGGRADARRPSTRRSRFHGQSAGGGRAAGGPIGGRTAGRTGGRAGGRRPRRWRSRIHGRGAGGRVSRPSGGGAGDAGGRGAASLVVGGWVIVVGISREHVGLR